MYYHTASKQLRQLARFNQLTRMDTAFTRFDSAVCELQRSSECYRRQMAWCRYQTIRIRKAMLQWKSVYQQWQCRMEDLFSTFSA